MVCKVIEKAFEVSLDFKHVHIEQLKEYNIKKTQHNKIKTVTNLILAF